MKPPKEGWLLRKAEEIEQGRFFVKRTAGMDGYAYLRVSDSSANFFSLQVDKFVYGVCYNGNMTAVNRQTEVWLVPPSQVEENRESERKWNRIVGAEDDSPYLREF